MTEDGSKTEDRSASSRSLSMGAGDRPKRENGSQTDQEASFADDVCQRAGRQRDEEHWQLVATCTSDTINGCVVRFVISHAAPALYIQVPTLATTVAVHITANVR